MYVKNEVIRKYEADVKYNKHKRNICNIAKKLSFYLFYSKTYEVFRLENYYCFC